MEGSSGVICAVVVEIAVVVEMAAVVGVVEVAVGKRTTFNGMSLSCTNVGST